MICLKEKTITRLDVVDFSLKSNFGAAKVIAGMATMV